MVFKAVVNGSDEEPEWPKILEAKLEEIVRSQNQNPEEQQLNIHQCAETIEVFFKK